MEITVLWFVLSVKLNSRTLPQEPLRMPVLTILTISSESFLLIKQHGERSIGSLSVLRTLGLEHSEKFPKKSYSVYFSCMPWKRIRDVIYLIISSKILYSCLASQIFFFIVRYTIRRIWLWGNVRYFFRKYVGHIASEDVNTLWEIARTYAHAFTHTLTQICLSTSRTLSQVDFR